MGEPQRRSWHAVLPSNPGCRAFDAPRRPCHRRRAFPFQGRRGGGCPGPVPEPSGGSGGTGEEARRVLRVHARRGLYALPEPCRDLGSRSAFRDRVRPYLDQSAGAPDVRRRPGADGAPVYERDALRSPGLHGRGELRGQLGQAPRHGRQASGHGGGHRGRPRLCSTLHRSLRRAGSRGGAPARRPDGIRRSPGRPPGSGHRPRSASCSWSASPSMC